MKVITPVKVVPYKCCLPSSNTSVKDFDTDVLFNLRCHTFLGIVCNVY